LSNLIYCFFLPELPGTCGAGHIFVLRVKTDGIPFQHKIYGRDHEYKEATIHSYIGIYMVEPMFYLLNIGILK
jgi:hypothetical protein